MAFVTWMLREGQQNRTGYAPSSASTHLAAAVVGLRRRGVQVSGDDQAAARRSAPTSTACAPSPVPAPPPSPATGTRP
ncbi:hypothetical protein DMH18_37645 [Streptomyces sp. WAC 06783]|uniref:hypothetical protein n=1 Tax=Streptomyces sp. WAC 06783 TaxID=2203211 RepID=UPI000F73CAA8|nr:hypothetical protein [Streptomyces sp. WAC 06783]RSO03342.1 hypothetical protein DMH18_37645 [Streptomyces sp. WAC 06783]